MFTVCSLVHMALGPVLKVNPLHSLWLCGPPLPLGQEFRGKLLRGALEMGLWPSQNSHCPFRSLSHRNRSIHLPVLPGSKSLSHLISNSSTEVRISQSRYSYTSVPRPSETNGGNSPAHFLYFLRIKKKKKSRVEKF